MKHSFGFRALALVLSLCLLLGLTACGGESVPATIRADDSPGSFGKDAKNGATGAPAEPHMEYPEALEPEAVGGPDLSYGSKTAADAISGMPDSEGAYAPADGAPEPGAAGEASLDGDGVVIDDPGYPYDPGEPLKLTAAEWNDLENWPFFTNLVNTGAISFPSFGLDPRNRIAVTVTDEEGAALVNETVTLEDPEGQVLWTARTDKTGTAYVFFPQGRTPDRVVCEAVSATVRVPETGGEGQGQTVMKPLEAVALTVPGSAPAQQGLQVLFIVDTTGSMMDEIAYLQKDFSAIAERVGSDGVSWSASFYRDEGDEYVTRHSAFTSDVAAVQARINAEYADGGGDTPEAVAEVLTECLVQRTDWEENCAKVAFLIFDAPPHEGKEAALQDAVEAAARRGIHVIPVVASNAERDTELFGRALAILTDSTYVFLTDDSGVGGSHLEPIVGDYQVELLQDLIVRLIEEYRP